MIIRARHIVMSSHRGALCITSLYLDTLSVVQHERELHGVSGQTDVQQNGKMWNRLLNVQRRIYK